MAETALTSMAQLVRHCFSKPKGAGSIPSQATCLGCRLGPPSVCKHACFPNIIFHELSVSTCNYLEAPLIIPRSLLQWFYIPFTFSYPISHVQILLIRQSLTWSPVLPKTFTDMEQKWQLPFLGHQSTVPILCHSQLCWVPSVTSAECELITVETAFTLCISRPAMVSGTELFFNKWLVKGMITR